MVRMGFLAGGLAEGGTKPNASSMYTSARRSVVPGWPRNQVTTLAKSSGTMNWRSSSDRWDKHTMEQRA